MSTSPRTAGLPAWAREMVELYESQAATQFILYGNVHDRFLLPRAEGREFGSLTDFLRRVLLPRFEVVLSYDLGNGLRVEKGGEIFTQWPGFKEHPDLPKQPRAAVELLTRYFRYTANLARLGQARVQVGCLIKSANLLAPALPGGVNHELHALALLMRDWADDPLLAEHALVTVLITESLE